MTHTLRYSHAATRLALFALCLLLASSVRAQPTVLVLGDSIGAAYGMSLQQGWVNLLHDKLHTDFGDIHMVNASISGETTAGGLKRLPTLLKKHAPDHVIIELGGNDGLRGYPLGLLEKNLENMVNLARNAGASVMLLPMHIPPNYGARYTNGFRATYDKVASSTQSLLGPFILQDVATDTTLMQPDGIHPTAAAQPLIVETIYPSVRTLLDTP